MIDRKGCSPWQAIAARLHAVSCFDGVFQCPGGHNGDDSDGMARPLAERTGGGIASDTALSRRAVSYTHLDVYKRQRLACGVIMLTMVLTPSLASMSIPV